MDENTFLKAQNLKNQISELEQLIKDKDREGAKIGIYWTISHTEYYNTSSTSWTPKTNVTVSGNEFPTYIKEKLIQLINEEIKRLKEEFNNL